MLLCSLIAFLSTMIQTTSLFDTRIDWRTQPMVAFGDFIRSAEFVALGLRRPLDPSSGTRPAAPIKDSSATVYLRMFGAFIRWLEMRQRTLYDFTPNDLEQFLEQGEFVDGEFVRQLNSAIRLRYVRLIERVLVHLQVVPNPAQHLCFAIYRHRQEGMAGEDRDKAVLSEVQQQAFMLALPTSPTGTNQITPASWKRRRDRAMQALMLGAGLKVSEVLSLRIDQVGQPDGNGSVPITLDSGAANSVTRPHRTQLRPFAAAEVLSWLSSRMREQPCSKLLFPASPDSNRTLDPATVYRQVKATFARAGIDPQRWGGRTLRNTFAVRELVETGSTELVGEFLGHRLQRSTLYYQDAANHRRKTMQMNVADESNPTTRADPDSAVHHHGAICRNDHE